MAGVYLRRPLSGSTDGRGKKITTTSTPGDTLHTAQASGILIDAVTLSFYNSDTVVRRVTVEWGGTTAPDDNIVIDLLPKGSGALPVVLDGVIRNSLVIKAFCDAANVVTCALSFETTES